jgi:hypothetical protein
MMVFYDIREIERVTGVHYTTVITWMKQIGELLPDAYAPDVIPEVGELDELETFVGAKKQNLALDSGQSLPSGNLSLSLGRP